MSTRKRTKQPTPKKTCQGACGKDKAHTFFFKVDSPLFPDGMINVCRDCVRESVNVNDIEQVIGFLRQIDKPFYQDEWEKALNGKNHPIGSYLGKINSLQQYKGKTFSNSDGVDGVGKVDLTSVNAPDYIEDINGEIIEYSDELVNKWGIGYSKTEYLQLEKFYRDTRATHEINTPSHIDSLTQLAYLTIDRNRLRQERDWGNYTKLSKTIDDMQKSAGFRPVDRQGVDDATGIKTFSQIFEKVEKEGFRKPPPPVFDEDIVDAMIVALANYYNRLVGKEILSQIPDELKEELNDFYEDDLTPVEINDEEYEDLDFSLDEDEDDILLLDGDNKDG
ncbi:hypothetical protein PQE75_gp236 [Bacillus phage vB_BcoS-136]|uniref:Uncharacterized protein n=1 Tax=Bacillus phage vB_BcoS-136 TaxID=2419619 RepID=A0A3G3BVG6_9CAUD|nr:hypothetical protein PQE75_gp236 [Bacillus phage vB_BcoS-136]AYP68243.1 hypothetical protein vBBcoS136_00128 [Bacillus phage vB_BcoS-136]